MKLIPLKPRRNCKNTSLILDSNREMDLCGCDSIRNPCRVGNINRNHLGILAVFGAPLSECHRTKDILCVEYLLEHKNIQNTMIYIDVETVLFSKTYDEFVVRVAHNSKRLAIWLKLALIMSLENIMMVARSS